MREHYYTRRAPRATVYSVLAVIAAAISLSLLALFVYAF